MNGIFIHSEEFKLLNTEIPGLNTTVRDLQEYISRTAGDQMKLFLERAQARGETHIDARYASIEYWLRRSAAVWDSRITWEIAVTADGVLFRISGVKPFERKKH